MSTSYQWLVARGRVAMWSEDSRVIVELDPEESAFCVLTVLDAKEIAGIISDQARAIWEASGNSKEPPADVEGDVHKACSINVGSSVLQVVSHDSEPFIAISLDTGADCKMNVTQAVVLVQVLQYMAEALESTS